jgi:hypothetical protein
MFGTVPACQSQWPLACSDCGFESHGGHGCLSLVSVVCCQVEVSATGLSLVQRSPTECGVSERDEDDDEYEPLAYYGLLPHWGGGISCCVAMPAHVDKL